MIVEAIRLTARTKTKPMESMNTFQFRWKLTPINQIGQGIQCGTFRGRSVTTTAAAIIQGHNGEDCSAEEDWFDILELDGPALKAIPTPTAWIRPVSKRGAIITVFFNFG